MSAPVLLAVTDAQTSLAHLVTVQAMAAGRLHGRYTAVCGYPVLAASLTAPASGSCQDCRRWRAGA
ncbi:MAG: hypothetical protein ACRDTH_22495 [Pseudonocardiaceae bacterium]